MSTPDSTLEVRWRATVDALPGSDTHKAQAFAEILARHGEAHRRYHGLSHLEHLFDLLDTHAPSPREPLLRQAAVWWHDAIYDPEAHDNEAQSANLARARLGELGAPAGLIADIERLIGATAAHWSAPPLGEGDYFLDADIAILGAPPDIYDRYAANVRAEYAFAPDLLYRAGRTKFLGAALLHKRLFRTDAFADRFEARARANLKRELLRFGGV